MSQAEAIKQTQQLALLKERLEPVFAQYANLKAVYLFGSTGTASQRPDSDLDLALVADSKALRHNKLNILSDLAQAGFDNVDLVILKGTDLVLQYEAVRRNQLIYHTPDFESGAFFSNTVRKYLDFLPYLEVQRQAYKQRLLNG